MSDSTTTTNNFTIKDDNSKVLSIIPKHWRVPLIIISYVKGYDGIDDYVLEMIRDRLAMFADTRDDLGENFQEYMKDIEGLTTEEDDEAESKSEKDYVNVKIDSDLVERLENLEERKKQQSEEVNENENLK